MSNQLILTIILTMDSNMMIMMVESKLVVFLKNSLHNCQNYIPKIIIIILDSSVSKIMF